MALTAPQPTSIYNPSGSFNTPGAGSLFAPKPLSLTPNTQNTSAVSGIKPNIPTVQVPADGIVGATKTVPNPLFTTPVNTTPMAHTVASTNPIDLPTNTSNAHNILKATSDAAMSTPPTTTPPPAYDKTTGFLTDYGRSQGMKPVQPNDPAGGSNSSSLVNSYLGNTAPSAPLTGTELYLKNLYSEYANGQLGTHPSSTPPNGTGTTTGTNTSGTTTSNGNPTADTSGNTNNAYLSKYNSLNNQLGTETQVRNDLNSQEQVDALQQEKIRSFNDYNSTAATQKQQIEDLYHQQGGTAAGVQAQVNENSRINSEILANKAIAATSAQGLYTTALDIVQRKMDAQFQPIQQQIDNMKAIVQSPNSNLTDSQKAQLQGQITQQTNNKNQMADAMSAVYQTMIQYGATSQDNMQALDKAQSLGDIYAVGAKITGDSNYGQAQTTGDGSSQSGGSFQTANGGTVNATDSQKVSQLPQLFQGYVEAGPKGVAYINADRVNPNQLAAIRTKAAPLGIPVLSGAEVSDVKSIQNTYQAVDAMSKLSTAALGSGLTGRILGLTINQLLKQFQTGGNVTDPITGTQVPLGILLGQFDQYRTSAINAVKSLVGGTGSGLRITAGEIQTASENLPTSADTLQSAETKIATFTKLLDNKLSTQFPSITNSGGSTSSSESTASGGWGSLGD